MKHQVSLSKVVTLGFLFAGLALAQEAQVSGRISDASGGVIPDVKVKITNTDTGSVRDTKTNSLGLYTLPLLQPGNYKINAEKQGFRPSQQAGIVLLVDQRATLDITMEVGQLTQEVEVTAAPLLLDTVEPSVGQVIENRQVVEIPLNGRNYITLGLLSGGTADPIAGSRDQGFSAGGQRLSANNYLLDGADNNRCDASRRACSLWPSLPSISPGSHPAPKSPRNTTGGSRPRSASTGRSIRLWCKSKDAQPATPSAASAWPAQTKKFIWNRMSL